VDRGVDDERLARTSRYAMFWSWLAAKDLEKAIHLDPRMFQPGTTMATSTTTLETTGRITTTPTRCGRWMLSTTRSR